MFGEVVVTLIGILFFAIIVSLGIVGIMAFFWYLTERELEKYEV